MYAIAEIKKDVEDFVEIAIEDNISKVQINNIFHQIEWEELTNGQKKKF
jgi:hypothetical protein